MLIFKLFSRNYEKRLSAKADLAKSLCRIVGWGIKNPTWFQKLVFIKLAPIIVEDDIWSLENFFPSHARDYLIKVNSSIKCSYYALLDYIERQSPDYVDEEQLALMQYCSDYEENIERWYDLSLNEFLQAQPKN